MPCRWGAPTERRRILSPPSPGLGALLPSKHLSLFTSFNGYFLFQDVPYVRNALIGGSFARQSSDRNVGGFYLGGNLWNFTYLGELDFIGDNTDVRPRAELAAYGELNLLLFDMDLQDAIDAPRFRHLSERRVALEPPISDEVRAALAAMGHEILPDGTVSFGGSQAVMRLQHGWAAGSDPRKDGMAVGHD